MRFALATGNLYDISVEDSEVCFVASDATGVMGSEELYVRIRCNLPFPVCDATMKNLQAGALTFVQGNLLFSCFAQYGEALAGTRPIDMCNCFGTLDSGQTTSFECYLDSEDELPLIDYWQNCQPTFCTFYSKIEAFTLVK